MKNASRQVLSKLKRPLMLLPPFVALRLKYLAGLSDFGVWLPLHSSEKPLSFGGKHDLFDYLAFEHIQDAPIDYLEFGVYKGDTLRKWCALSTRPESRFWGFDCFTGLPEDWAFPTGTLKKGIYDAGGVPPQISDPRVQLVKGMFQDSLPGFLQSFVPLNRLVIHLDADLYSSTLYVLATLHPRLTPGSVLILDDFCVITDVFRALSDYMKAFRKDYRVLGSSGVFYDTAAVEIVQSRSTSDLAHYPQ